MKVYLDNTPIQNPNPSLLEPKFSIRRSSETGEQAISFTGDLNFTNADYDYIYGKLVTSPTALQNNIILKFIDDCCNDKEYIFQIKPESLRWCNGSCEISANALEYSLDAQAYACVANTFIWDNHNGFQTQYHPRIAYCLEYRPSILQDLGIILTFLTFIGTIPILGLVSTVILPLIGTINLIITAVNTIPGVDISEITIGGFSDPIDIFNYGKGLIKDANTLAIGCGYNHPSPLARSYVENVCAKCGIGFSSSILNDPANTEYFKLVYFSAQVHKGQNKAAFGKFNTTLVNYMMVNKPIHTGKTFLDEVQQAFNAKWDIHNGVLRFERHDFFENQLPWLDLTSYDPKKIVSVCYEWTKKPRYALANIEYSKDGFDWVGDEAHDRWSDQIEWNSPPNQLQKGIFQKSFPFGAARFRGDGIDRDVLGDYKWMSMGFGDAIKANEDVMIMNNGTAFLPKLLILRDGTTYDHALIENKYGTFADTVDGYRTPEYPNQAYNMPMWVREGLPLNGAVGNLYSNFWNIENPRSTEWSGYDFTVTLIWDCATLNAVNIDGTIMLDKGLAKVESIDLDFSESKIIIKGTL